jgi:hypothetical protein
VTAPPPDDPDGPRDGRDLDFDAEFERIVADWGPSSVEPDEIAQPSDDADPTSAEPGDAEDTPDDAGPSSVPPGAAPGEPGATSPPDSDSLRKLFRGAWGDEGEEERAAAEHDPEEHYVPPPAPPIPRPEPRRLLAWAGMLGAPVVALVLLVLGSLPSFVSVVLFCWFVGGFGYLVATMNDRGGDGWDDGAQV